MRQPRSWIPLLGILALIALLLKMPEAPDVFGIFKCKTCATNSPYLPMIGGGYFALLIALSLLFPKFPGPLIARGGLIWSILLAGSLTFLDFPSLCIACLIGHLCNILIWTIWLVFPTESAERSSSMKERLFLTLFAPIAMIAFFSSLNLTFMIYNLKAKQHVLTASLQPGDVVPSFTSLKADLSSSKSSFINFVSPNCPYCLEQLPIFDRIAAELVDRSYRFINISPALTKDLIQKAPSTEWLEDGKGELRDQFKVSGYPTLFVVSPEGKIQKVVTGVSEELNISRLID